MDWYNGSKEEKKERREYGSPSNCFSFHCAGGVEQRVDRNVQSAGFERPWWTYGEGWSSWGREQDAMIPNEVVVVLQPFNRTQFSTVVYLPMACIFIAFPKTNFVGAWPLTSDANESCGKTEWRPNSGYRVEMRQNRWIGNRPKGEDWLLRFIWKVAGEQ